MLFILQRGDAVTQVRCYKPVVSIGRLSQSDIYLEDPLVSKRHAEIVIGGGRVLLRDLESMNGTFVNGERIAEPKAIRPEDVVRIGAFTLRFEIEEERTRVTSVVSAPASPPPGAPPPVARGETQGPKVHGARPEPATSDLQGPPTLLPPARAPIVRYPAIDAVGDVRPGSPLTLTIDLTETRRDPRTQSSGVRIANVPAQWEGLDVGVRLTAPGLIFAPGDDEGIVKVRRFEPAIPCACTGIVDPDLSEDVTSIDVVATFFHAGRCCGSARRVLDVAQRSAPPPLTSETRPLAVSEQSGVLTIDPRARAPALTVKIYRPIGSDPTLLYWVLDVPPERRIPALRGRFSEAKSIGVEPAKLVQSVFGDVPTRVDDALLRGLGERLYDAAPRCFHDVYTALRAAFDDPFPIQFVCDEPNVPWELMCPYGAAPLDGEFLAKRHPVARWYEEYHGYLTQRIPHGAIGTIAPDYAGRADVKPLDSARRESQRLERDLGAIRIPGRKAQLVSLFEHAGPVTIIHFAGHGSPRALFLEDEDLSFLELRASEAHTPRFVFLNACGVGSGMEAFGTVSGWAAALMRLRCGAVLAPAWAVWDGDAEGWVDELLRALLEDHLPIAETLRRLRVSHWNGSGSMLAYVLHGDVMAQME